MIRVALAASRVVHLLVVCAEACGDSSADSKASTEALLATCSLLQRAWKRPTLIMGDLNLSLNRTEYGNRLVKDDG